MLKLPRHSERTATKMAQVLRCAFSVAWIFWAFKFRLQGFYRVVWIQSLTVTQAAMIRGGIAGGARQQPDGSRGVLTANCGLAMYRFRV